MKVSHLITGIVFLSLVSCQSNTYDEIAGAVTEPEYYKTNVKPIMTANCISCHNPTFGQTPYLETYLEVKASCQSSLVCRIKGSCGEIMPQSGSMPQTNIEIIDTWIVNGYN